MPQCLSKWMTYVWVLAFASVMVSNALHAHSDATLNVVVKRAFKVTSGGVVSCRKAKTWATRL